MKGPFIFLLLFLFGIVEGTIAQKTISDATISYNINILSSQKQAAPGNLNGSTYTVFLKGPLSRTDMTSNLGSEKVIHDGKAGTAVMLREYSGQKLMITLTKEDWDQRNKKTANLNFNFTNETKEISGYACTKATANLSDGKIVTVFFTKDLVSSNKDYNPTFQNLPGLPLEYEFESGNMRFIYTLNKIDFNSIPAVKFEYPKSGYRIITYAENKSSENK